MNEFTYNLNLNPNQIVPASHTDKYKNKLETNQALIATLGVLQKQVTLNKSYVEAINNRPILAITLETYSTILESLCLTFLKRNVQSRDIRQSKLTGYSVALNQIRGSFTNLTTGTNGLLGTLINYNSSKANLTSELLNIDYIEKTIINYWNYLEIDYLLSPRQRFIQVLNELNFSLNSTYYLDLTTSILDLITNDSTIAKKFNSLLLDYSDLQYLNYKLYTLEYTPELKVFLAWLYENTQHTLLDITMHEINYIKYKPIGSLVMVLTSFIVEGLVLASRYIKDLPAEYRGVSIEKWKTMMTDNTVKVYSQTIAKYLGLVYDAVDWLQFVYEDMSLFKESVLFELSNFMIEPILAKGEYRLDG